MVKKISKLKMRVEKGQGKGAEERGMKGVGL
jgi:hypothetical protein